MKTDATKACTTCQNCGQASNWTHDDGGCPYCSKPRGLSPIAAPAAHVERRKGQRWRRQWRDMTEEVTLLDRSTWAHKPGWNVAPGVALHDACWTDASLGNIMTLLVDAPPEPAKPTTPQCDPSCRPGLRCLYCTTEVAPSSSPAQEAPKAAPVQSWFTDDEGEKIGPFATGLEADDASVAYGAWMRTQTGTPYAGPTRLPRPQLAADWVEDCLPEGGR